MSPSLVKWDDPKVEPKVEDEDGKIQKMIDIINSCQSRNFTYHRHAFRGTHVKTQAVVKGELTVKSDIPPHLAQGLFSQQGKTYPIAIRYANEPIFLQDDKAPGPRGCGMKVFNVDQGPFLDDIGEKTHTQDFTFNNAPILELTDLPTCVEIFTLREKYFDDKEGLTKELEKRPDKDLQFAPGQLPNQHFMSYTMYSQSAYRYGDNIAKFALFPSTKLQQDLAESAKITESSAPDQHTTWLREFFNSHDAKFDFRVQLCQDLDAQSVEDTSKDWDQSKYPFETVGKVVLHAKQDIMESRRRSMWDDHVRLNQWYGLEAHRPLGSVNRLRKKLYKASAEKRAETNAADPTYLKSIDQLP